MAAHREDIVMNRVRRVALDRSPNELQRIARIYDEHAPMWDQREGRGENLVLGEAYRERLVRLLDGNVLEIGAGTGETLRRLQAAKFPIDSYTGIDISTGMLAQASKYIGQSPFPVTLQQMNAENLTSFPDDAFDTVTASLVLCTVPDQKAALHEMARVVKPDGKIVLIEHVLAKNPLVKTVMKVLAPVQRRHMACHIDRTTDRTLRDLGFRIERDDSRMFGIVHLIVARPPRSAATSP
jgi:ubiquinone/menaquinone biosynthesis C-methylase UbiE